MCPCRVAVCDIKVHPEHVISSMCSIASRHEVNWQILTLCFLCCHDIFIMNDTPSDCCVIPDLLVSNRPAATSDSICLLYSSFVRIPSICVFVDDVLVDSESFTLERVPRNADRCQQRGDFLRARRVFLRENSVELHIGFLECVSGLDD